jgi:GH15 family glucan-1,4-alpha-glucosidase
MQTVSLQIYYTIFYIPSIEYVKQNHIVLATMQKNLAQFDLLNKSIEDFNSYGETLFTKSLEIIKSSQLSTGGTTASLPGTRYAGHVYPRDHGYATRAYIAADKLEEAEKALDYILNCDLDPSGIMYQRYDEHGKNASYKPPQIDGNAQTLLSLAEFIKASGRTELLRDKRIQIDALLMGIKSQLSHFPKGTLAYSINGIIEYSSYEAGFELYTNAVCYKAIKEIGSVMKNIKLDSLAEKIKDGISAYLYYPSLNTFIPCLRREPDVSFVLLANLKSFLALTDFDVFDAKDEQIQSSLQYHLKGTSNGDLGAYNRYHYLMDRHNFGNGPWPMVMLRLAQYYNKIADKEKQEQCFTWVMNVAKNNLDQPDTLPEHVSTDESFIEEYEAFIRINDTAPRPSKEKEYTMINESRTFKELRLAYAVNPLVWSHSQFILAWKETQ